MSEARWYNKIGSGEVCGQPEIKFKKHIHIVSVLVS